MNRKDTILIAVVINAGLLAVLFATAIISDTDKVLDQAEVPSTIVEASPSLSHQPAAPSLDVPATLVASAESLPREDLDNLNRIGLQQPILVEVQNSEAFKDEIPQTSTSDKTATSQETLIEVTVKKGDVLEKIAKAHGTTVAAIKKANQLKNERLQIGQVLKIPIKKDEKNVQPQAKKSADSQVAEGTYYTIKSGDNPWKIAKQFNVGYEDIIRLNNLDEEKARNLKAGDKIRVK